jgi:diguanylate cyclase (GGDEF)-like protein/PAS domain S-box-containing protein
VLNEAKRMGLSHGQQIQLPTDEGSKWFELSTSILNRGSDPPRFLMLSRDITSRKEAEQALKTLQNRYQGMFQNMVEGVAVYQAVDDGEDFIFVDFNPAAESIEGVKKQDLIGKKITDMFPHIREMGLLEVLQRVWKTGTAEACPVSLYRNERLSGWRENFVYKLDSGELVTVYRDETEKKQAEQRLQESERLKKLIINSTPDLMWLKDNEGIYLACNPEFERFFGASENEIIGKTDYDFVDSRLADFFRKHDLAAMQAGKSLTNEEWIKYADDGHEALLETTKTPLQSANGKVIGVLGIGRDITSRYDSEQQLRLAASVFSYSREGILITDMQQKIIDANPACYDVTGYSRDELIGNNPRMLSSGRQSEQFYREMWEQINREGHWQGELLNRKKSGEVYTELLSIDVVHDQLGGVRNYVGVFSDISYLKEQEQALQRVAYSDTLTGLPNRLLLKDRKRQAINRAERHESLAAVSYLDLDGFKPINDQYGHEAGDEVLVEVSERLQHVLRHEDTVARLGGDEFVLLIQNIKHVLELEQLLERVLIKISEPYITTAGHQVAVSASIGVALYPLDDADPDTLLRHADQAMYQAKNQGKNRFSYFDSGEEERALKNQRLHKEIEQALLHDELKLLYQPKVNMRSGEVFGAEALLRWRHPRKGLLLPADFLPEIERSQLIVRLGDWVITQALTQLQKWKAQGRELQLSINIAPLQIQQANFVSKVEQSLRKFPEVSAKNLEFEILETAALHDFMRVSSVMKQCKKLGIEFALDDFGIGYSSMTCLKQLPAKRLKIDQSFICNMLEAPEDVAISEGILGLARAFGREVIAEGVETVRHGGMLLGMGCDLGQGYGIARAMPGTDLIDWIENFKADEKWLRLRQRIHPAADVTLLVMAVEHQKLVARVINAIKNSAAELIPDNIQDTHQCRLGQWLDDDGRAVYQHEPAFQHLVDQHEKIHQICYKAEQQLKQGQQEQLQATCQEINKSRHEVLDSLNELRKEAM